MLKVKITKRKTTIFLVLCGSHRSEYPRIFRIAISQVEIVTALGRTPTLVADPVDLSNILILQLLQFVSLLQGPLAVLLYILSVWSPIRKKPIPPTPILQPRTYLSPSLGRCRRPFYRGYRTDRSR